MNIDNSQLEKTNMPITRGAILIILFLILFSSFSVAANEDEVIIKCREAIYNLDVSPPFVVASLFDGTVQVFDTTGALVHDIDLKLAVPSIEDLKSLRADTDKFVDVDYDFAVFFPKSDKFVVARVRYSQSESNAWQIIKNLLRDAIGMGSSIEVWDAGYGQKIFEEDVTGFLSPKAVDFDGDLLAFIVHEGISAKLVLADIGRNEITEGMRVSTSAQNISVDNDKLFVIDEKKLTIYDIVQTKGLIESDKIHFNCIMHPYFVFEGKRDSERRVWAFNACIDSTIGKIGFVGDSTLFERIKEIIKLTPTQVTEFKFPVGRSPISGELILESFSDTLYLVDFNKNTIRTRLVSEIVDTTKYFLPSPIVSNYFYSKMKDTGHKDSTFAILKIDL